MAIADSAAKSGEAWDSSAYTWVDKSAASDAQWQLIEEHSSYKAIQTTMKQAADLKRTVEPTAKGKRRATTTKEAKGVLAKLMKSSGLTEDQMLMVQQVTQLLDQGAPE